MNYFNVPLAASVVSWLTAQIIKTVAYAVKNKRFNSERIFGPGGMPSAHSATVVSLVIVISRTEGLKSAEFAMSAVLAMIVMYDAIGVRRSAGLHARAINRLRRIIAGYEEKLSQPEKDELQEIDEVLSDDDDMQKELKEILGHTPIEVIFGALLGILVGMIFTM